MTVIDVIEKIILPIMDNTISGLLVIYLVQFFDRYKK